jgi:hypothetical protein
MEGGMRERVVCRLEKKTPGALQYKQIDRDGQVIRRDQDGQVVGNLYLRKSAIEGRIPEKITVTIEY